MQFAIAGNALGMNITVFDDAYDYPQVASDKSNPNFDKILELAKAGEHIPVELFDPSLFVAEKFKSLSERVTVSGGTLFFDHEPVHNSIAEHVLRFLEEKVDDWEPLVKFFEKIQQNPNNHSREQLYDWLGRYDFTIDDDGDIIAYKGVRKHSDGSLWSISSGSAIVNGEKKKGHIPNEIDSVIEMPRLSVHHDPATGCSTGLHAGTYEYASDFAAGALLQVAINPRDVVSVPTDCAWQKVRCCRYRVIDIIDHKISEAVRPAWDNVNQDWDEDEDLEWGDGEGDDWDDDGLDDAPVTGQDPYANDVNTRSSAIIGSGLGGMTGQTVSNNLAGKYDPATGLPYHSQAKDDPTDEEPSDPAWGPYWT